MDEVAERTNRFYSHFCGADIAALQPGMHFICSAERDAVLRGLGCKYMLFVLVKDRLCVASYSPAYSDRIEPMKAYGPEAFILELSRCERLKNMRLMQFGGETVMQYDGAEVLGEADYPLYEAFYQTIHPGGRTEDWLYDYFMEKIGYFTAFRSGGRLLSVCDAPDMPYMEGEIQHTGIYTLQSERRKGYARRTAALATHTLLARGICPQWECCADNLASIGLAKSIGYTEYATAYILEE